MKAKYNEILQAEIEALGYEQELDASTVEICTTAANKYALLLCKEFVEKMIETKVIVADITKEELDAVFKND